MKAKWKIATISAVFVLLADRLTKWLVVKHIPENGIIKVNEFLNIVHVLNPGGIFGIGGYRSSKMFLIASLFTIFVVILLIKRLNATDRINSLFLGMILGGGISNVIDRIIYGRVIDFIDFHYKDLHWPSFNVADSSIVVAVIGLLIFYKPAVKDASLSDRDR